MTPPTFSSEDPMERRYQEQAHLVFAKLQQVLTQQFEFEFDFIDPVKYIFSTTEIRQKTVQGPVKYRVNASIRTDPETGATVLRIFKQEKTYQNNHWQSTPSNGKLEDDIFDALKN